jgi:ribosomal protein S4E
MVKKLVIVLGVAAVFMAANVFAAGTEPKKPEHAGAATTVTVEGTVSVTKDANSVVTSIKLTTANKTVYNVILDEKGKELAALDGKEVRVKGVVSEKDGQKWIKVQEFKPVEKKKENTQTGSKPAPLK